MKVVKYILFGLLITFINFCLIIAISPSVRHNVFGYLKTVKYKTTSEIPKKQQRKVKKQVNTNKNEGKKFSKSPEINHTGLSSKDTCENKVIKLVKGSQSKSIDSINQKDSLGSGITSNKNQGYIYVMSTPQDASVKIGDNIVGNTPLTVCISPCGICNVDVRLKYYEPWSDDVEVFQSEVTKIHAKLKPGKGSLTVVSVPQEADVYLDKKFKGKTPLTIKSQEAGKHDLYVVKNEKEYKNQVEILTAENNLLNINLKVLKSKLRVNSKPSNAKVYIDGIHVGVTPVEVNKVEIGGHHLILVKGDSLAYVDSIVVDPEKENLYFVTLENKIKFAEIFSGKIKVKSELKDTYVYIDGRFRGKAPMEIDNLRTGENEIMLIKATSDGSYVYKSKLHINSNETKEISINVKEFEFKKLH